MKKLIFGLLALTFLFVSCSNSAGGSGGGNSTTSGGTQTPTTYTVTFNANDGSENPATATQTFTKGTPQALKTIAELGFSKSGFNFAGWGTTNNSAQSSYADGSSYTAKMDTTLYALWSIIPIYAATISNTIENGTVNATPATATAGTEITLSATPNTGYDFVSYTVTAIDGSIVTVNNGKFTMPEQNVNVTATFKLHIPADGFVVVDVTSDNITSVIKNATQNTRIMFSEIYLPTDAATALNENSSVKFIFDFSKSPDTAIYPKHHFNNENTNVVAIVLSDKITILGMPTFSKYKGLTEITIPASVTEIGMDSFRYCTNLKKVEILNPNVFIKSNRAFWDCPNVEELTTSCVCILDKMGAENLKTLNIIGAPKVFGGLKGNKKITSIALPEGVEEVEDYGLAGEVLETVSLPSTLKKIGKYAFGDNVKYLTCNQLDGWWYNSYFYAGYNRNYNSTGATNLLFNLFKHEDYRTEPCYKVSGRNEIPSSN